MRKIRESVFICWYDRSPCDRFSKRYGTGRCIVANKVGNPLSVCPRLDKKRTVFVDADVSLEGVPVK